MLIMLILLTILVVKLIECLSYSTVFFKATVIVDTIPRESTISTYQDDEMMAPYMLALRVDNTCSNKTTITASAVL